MSVKDRKHSLSRSNITLLVLGILWLVLAGIIMAIQLGSPSQIEIEWETETEFDTAGFNVYRSDSPDGEFVKINDQLIPSASDAAAGASYIFVDDSVERGKTYYYRLEDVEYSSESQQHEILSGRASAIAAWAIVLSVVSAVIGLVLITSVIRQRRNHGTESNAEVLT